MHPSVQLGQPPVVASTRERLMDTAMKTSPISVAAAGDRYGFQELERNRRFGAGNQFPTKLIVATSLTDFPAESVTVSRNM